MRSARRIILTLSLASALMGAIPAMSHAAPVRCQEDEPCWVWSTMGNRHRGIFNLRTQRIEVVGPCRFAKLWMYGNVDLSAPGYGVTSPMRGDWHAIQHGCDPFKGK